ncbi:platelet endothelial cell adhesion molecule isoform X1 [Lates japonicus]|uniref:Platelet endothelial cell adhesion molecule isoform X1 n=1 Tax=Lates japonicus TaxID=270547 RepID=A0AAD3MVF9_LATJO|nr:platelet endothelial cell adhesion molecule isoform X1 [Lates japonicus]
MGGIHKEGEGQQTLDASWDQDTHGSPVIDGDNGGNGLNRQARRTISGHRSEQPGNQCMSKLKDAFGIVEDWEDNIFFKMDA